MNFVEFSNKIIETNDIDPDYIFLINYKNDYGVSETFDLLKKKLLIYNLKSELLYKENIITSSEIKFGNERQKSKNYFIEWEKELNKIDFNKLNKFHNVDYRVFKKEFTKIKGMGNWAAWKCADILDKVFNIKMLFNDEIFLEAYEYPLRGLLMLNKEKENINLYSNKALFKSHLSIAKEYAKSINKKNIWDASNILELETLLCKYHSYKHNKYKIGQDLQHVRAINNDERLIKYHKYLP